MNLLISFNAHADTQNPYSWCCICFFFYRLTFFLMYMAVNTEWKNIYNPLTEIQYASRGNTCWALKYQWKLFVFSWAIFFMTTWFMNSFQKLEKILCQKVLVSLFNAWVFRMMFALGNAPSVRITIFVAFIKLFQAPSQLWEQNRGWATNRRWRSLLQYHRNRAFLYLLWWFVLLLILD